MVVKNRLRHISLHEHVLLHEHVFQIRPIQKYLYKLSEKRLSGKVSVLKTSCMGNNERIMARKHPGNVLSGKCLSGKVTVRETSVNHNVS